MPRLALSDVSGFDRDSAVPAPEFPAAELLPLNDNNKFDAARRLYELSQVEVSYEEECKALWTFMRPRGRPCYNPELLEE